MSLTDHQLRTLVKLARSHVTPELLDRAKLALRVYGIPYGDLQAANNNLHQLYKAIERHSVSFVGHDALSLLQFVLQMVGVNADKVKELGSKEKCLEACRKSSKFSKLVYRLCAELSEDDCTHLQSLACEYIDVDAQTIVSREDLFQRCISQEVLQKDDMEFKQFKDWLSTLGRNDLVSDINTYISERAKEAPTAHSNSPDGPHIYNVGTPSNLVPYIWFHGNTNRQEAEERLHSVDYPCFLVRPSEKFGKDSLSLSIKDDQGRITHYRIIRGTGWYEINGTFSRHSSLPELVSYFKTHSVTNDSNHKLTSPCPKAVDPLTSSTSLGGLSMSCGTTDPSFQELQVQGVEQMSPPPVVSRPKLTWRESAELPVVMSRPQVVRIGNKIYVGGGYTKEESKAYLILEFNTESEVWSRYCNCPNIEFGLTQLNGKLVAVGGVENGKDNNSPSNKVYVYDKEWFDSRIPPFKTARFYPASFSYESNLIVAGGGTKMVGNTIIPTPSIEVYLGATNLWSSTVELPLPKLKPSTATSVFVSNDHVYLLHYDQCMSIGLSSLVSEAQSTDQSKSKDQTSVPPSSSWKVLPCPLKCSAIAVVNDKLIAVGGRRDGVIRNTVYVFNRGTDSWGILQASVLPVSRFHAGIAQMEDGRVLVIGGEEKGSDGSLVVASTCYVGSLL